MRKKLRIGCGLLLVIALVLCGLYWALRHEPRFYDEQTRIDPAISRGASDEMLQRVAVLRNDLEKEGPWQALFTAEQINGWLAVDLVDNHPDLLPGMLQDPRVEIRPDGITLAARMEQRGLNTVVNVDFEPYLQEENQLALRVRGVRAGLLPMPLSQVLEAVSEGVEQMDLQLYWQQTDGDPVALISLPPLVTDRGRSVQIETLKLGEGEIYLAGTAHRQ